MIHPLGLWFAASLAIGNAVPLIVLLIGSAFRAKVSIDLSFMVVSWALGMGAAAVALQKGWLS